MANGVDHAWWDGPFLVHATFGVRHGWGTPKMVHPARRGPPHE